MSAGREGREGGEEELNQSSLRLPARPREKKKRVEIKFDLRGYLDQDGFEEAPSAKNVKIVEARRGAESVELDLLLWLTSNHLDSPSTSLPFSSVFSPCSSHPRSEPSVPSFGSARSQRDEQCWTDEAAKEELDQR